MKFTCTQENLVHGLSLINRVAGKNAALPILHNILIQATEGKVQLTTTNLELGLTTTIRAKVETVGSYTVQARVFYEFITLLGNEKCSIELTDGGLLVTAGQTKSTIKGLPAEEFPVLPAIDPSMSTEVDGQHFKKTLESVAFAVANDESRPEISGVLISFSGRTITATATDSYRLAERQMENTKQADKPYHVILPARSAEELLRLVPAAGPITVAVSDNQFFCQTPDVSLISRTIEGHYPDYQQIIPANATTTVKIPKDQFINAVRAASLFCKPGINDIAIGVDPKNKTIILHAANTTTGEHQGELPCQVTGAPQATVYNYRYLLEGAQSFSDDEILLELQDSQAPGVFRPTSTVKHLYLLMPIRQ